MKQDDVRPNGETRYLTRVGSVLVPVVVTSFVYGARGMKFTCRRVDNGNVLPKLRSASALRPMRKT